MYIGNDVNGTKRKLKSFFGLSPKPSQYHLIPSAALLPPRRQSSATTTSTSNPMRQWHTHQRQIKERKNRTFFIHYRFIRVLSFRYSLINKYNFCHLCAHSQRKSWKEKGNKISKFGIVCRHVVCVTWTILCRNYRTGHFQYHWTSLAWISIICFLFSGSIIVLCSMG